MNFFEQFKDFMFKGEQEKKFYEMWDRRTNPSTFSEDGKAYHKAVAWQMCVMQSKMEELQAQINQLKSAPLSSPVDLPTDLPG